MNTQNYSHSQKQTPKPTSNSVISNDQPRYSQDQSKNYPVMINQIFLNQTHEMNKYDNLEIVQHHTLIFFNHKTQSIHNPSNQLKRVTKSHCHIIYNNK